eukprot:5315915-Lingulodinium_polyedra.AAC.1
MPGDRLVKLDIKDFYVKGEHVDLSRCCNTNERGLDKEGDDLLLHVLHYQFVEVPELNCLYRVKTRTGIGQTAYGEIADWNFFTVFEDAFILQPAKMIIGCGYKDWQQ